MEATGLTSPRPWWNAVLPAARPARDAMLAAGVLLVDLLTQWRPGATDRLIGHGPMPWPYVVGYAVAGVAALTWRRSWPAPVFAVLWAHSVVGTLFLPGYRPTLGLLVAFYTVASRTRLGWSLTAFAAIGAPSALAVLKEIRANPPELLQSTLVAGTTLYFLLDLSVWVAGRWVRRSRHDLSDAEKRRQAAAAAAVAEERGRVARELHDIVAHSVTIMVLQAAGARRVIRADPQVERALADIEACGRQAMADMRRLLRLLATSGTYAGEDVAGLEPHPGLADLPSVIGRVQAAGLRVDMRTDGVPVPLGVSVDLAAYRVVAEALTNALKHAGAGAHADVLLSWHDATLRVTVTDDGRGHPQTEPAGLSNGRGLLGLAERVRAVDGTLEAGARPEGGYRVSATLPAVDPVAAAPVAAHLEVPQ
jgi:signal transduction histidine kinase